MTSEERDPGNGADLQARIGRAVAALRSAFGDPVWRRKQPLDELMLTLLSQNTNDNNRDLAYRRLREKFGTWEEVRDAGTAEIEEAIRPAGLSKQKSARMKDLLQWVELTFGGLHLRGLEELSDDEAIALLTSRTGIGVKTAAVLLAFAFDRDLCPVDTHVERIAERLGWAPQGMGAARVFHRIKPHIPSGTAARFHLNLLKFGRTICKARSPRCGECPLQEDCVYPNKTGSTFKEGL